MSVANAANNKPVVVTAAIIRHGDKILIARRLHDAKIEAGKWEFPGGKVEFGEHPEVCLKREILEELNVEIEVGALYDVVSHIYQDSIRAMHIILLVYLCTFRNGEVRHLDVSDAAWITVKQLGDYEWAAADLPIVEKLKRL